MDYQPVFLQHLDLIEQVIRYTARRHHLSATEQDEFAAVARLKLIEQDYAILRKFEHRSSIRTYLITVLERLFLDHRNMQWGRWRPSAEARRLGPTAVLLERLITRDGLRLDEALETVRSNYQVEATVAELRGMAAALPVRMPRTRVTDEELVAVPAAGGRPDEGLLRREQAAQATRLSRALDAALAELAPPDALLLRLRFIEGLHVSTIARTLRREQKALYRRLDRLKAGLRAALEAQGFSVTDIQGFFGSDAP